MQRKNIVWWFIFVVFGESFKIKITSIIVPPPSTTINTLVSSKISVFCLKQKVFQDYLEINQIYGFIHNLYINHSFLNCFTIFLTILLFLFSLIESENKTKISKLQKLGISKKMEKYIEIFYLILMVTVTKNVESAS